MYSIVPFMAGAVIAVVILSAFAPMNAISTEDSLAITQAQGTPSNGTSVPSGKGGPGDIKGDGSSDGSTGPTRPNANAADGSDANKAAQDKQHLRPQPPRQTDPSQPAPATK